jgi:hypothetical protein
MMPEITALERESLIAIFDWPRYSHLLPDQLVESIPRLNKNGLVWLKCGCWTVTDAGEQALAAQSRSGLT